MKTVHRREMWQIRFDRVEGSEIGKTRPVLVLQNNIGNRYASTTIVAAITGRIRDLPTLVDVEPSPTSGLQHPCVINLSHIRTISQSRLVKRIGLIEEKYLPKTEQATMISLGFD